jgi:hypothetical protein
MCLPNRNLPEVVAVLDGADGGNSVYNYRVMDIHAAVRRKPSS